MNRKYSTVLGVNGWAGSAWWGWTFLEVFIKKFMKCSWKFQEILMRISWNLHDLFVKFWWNSHYKFMKKVHEKSSAPQLHEKFFLLEILFTRSWSVSKVSRTFKKLSRLSKCLPLVVSNDLCARTSCPHWPQTCLKCNFDFLLLGRNDLPFNAKTGFRFWGKRK